MRAPCAPAAPASQFGRQIALAKVSKLVCPISLLAVPLAFISLHFFDGAQDAARRVCLDWVHY